MAACSYAISQTRQARAPARATTETSYAYDALDRLVSTTMPGGGTTRYAYDTLGRMTSRHHPDADGATLYKYDDLGRVRFSQDARQRAAGTGANRKVTYTVYDDFGRVTRVGEAEADFSELDPERSYPFENDASSWRSRMTYDAGDLVAGNGASLWRSQLRPGATDQDRGEHRRRRHGRGRARATPTTTWAMCASSRSRSRA